LMAAGAVLVIVVMAVLSFGLMSAG
jgi:hypothetical protein